MCICIAIYVYFLTKGYHPGPIELETQEVFCILGICIIQSNQRFRIFQRDSAGAFTNHKYWGSSNNYTSNSIDDSYMITKWSLNFLIWPNFSKSHPHSVVQVIMGE